MFRNVLAWIAVVSGAGLFPAASAAREATSESASRPQLPLFRSTLAPSLRLAASRDGVELFADPRAESRPGGIDDGFRFKGVPQLKARPPAGGDAVVLWVGVCEGTKIEQWLIEFRRGTATPDDQLSARGADRTKYLSWGPVVTFSSQVEALDVWMAGPVNADDDGSPRPMQAAPTKRLRVKVPGDYLRLGLDDSARVSLHLNQRAAAAQRANRPFNFDALYSTDKRVPEKRMREARQLANEVGFAPQMERAWVGGHVALHTFYDLASKIPELREIAMVAIARPSVWQLTKYLTGTRFRGGLGGPETRPTKPADLGLMPVPLDGFSLPYSMKFGDEPLVTGEMIVVAPIPPLDVTAGIIGLIAVNPKHPERRVHIIAIAATPGASAK